VGGLSTPEHLDMINGTPLRQAGPRGRRTVVAAATVLGPPGRQKVEALGVLKSFPSLEKQLGLDYADDV